ncbi:MAG: UvrD-helicase domain-containing protein [Eubacterium sp.]|nr:UvrD-helicase domain-containing protein [Eubacterium sp.]
MISMNDMQQQAVEHTEGPLLILAGAGSGKTRVITRRAAYLINECGVDAYNILAITFTNKAAGEMKTRIAEEVGFGSEGVWCATFHSTCVRILRRFIDRLGYDTGFTIYDTDDQKTLMKQIIKSMNLDPKQYKERTLLNAISKAKDELISPIEYRLKAQGDWSLKTTAEIYTKYQAALKANNALDFDDLIFKTVELLQDHADVLRYYQDRFRYIMVDEYQDTNTAQFVLIKLLAGRHENLCVVGDDDQSIYKFRGANIRNILDFEKTYPNAKVIRLEQNYRSSGNILNAANGVISHNSMRKGKNLWTAKEDGEKITFNQFDNAYEEADFVARGIKASVRRGGSFMDNAVLYRTNAQSRVLEEKLINAGIPYKIVGGVNFYARREVKDMIAYLTMIDNSLDDLAIRRIINVPKRGIGQTSIDRVQEYADENGISFYDAISECENISTIKRGASKIREFADFAEGLKKASETMSLSSLMKEIIDKTGYVEELRAERTVEADTRIENIEELYNKVVSYEEGEDEPTLSGFLQEVSLVADIDSMEDDADYAVLMTLHSAKGLEFDNVYMVGMEDGLFPSYMCITSDDPTEIEEERRLCYVGITRAKKHLTMTAAKMRMVRGETQYNGVSRFVNEVPKNLVEGFIPKSYSEREKLNFNAPEKREPSYLKSKPYALTYSKGSDFGIKDASALGYDVGDRVIHTKFGEGVVEEIAEGGRDFEVTVTFDGPGRKKMFASFAKLKKA